MKSLYTYIRTYQHITEQNIDIKTSGTINIFIGCSKSKEDKTEKAEDLYIGTLFKKSLAIANKFKNARIYILSGKHGLVRLDDKLKPYDEYIGDKSEEDNKLWAEDVIKQMKSAHIDFNDKTYFFCGEDYYKNIIDHFTKPVTVFEKGLGYSLEKLDSLIKKYDVPNHDE